MLVPLHNHSDYSNLDGNALPVEIAARVEQIGATACAITDHGVVAGHLDFTKAMKSRGLKPIYGVEAYHGTKWNGFKGSERDASHLILLAQSDKGLRNLWTLVDKAATPETFRFVPRMSWETLKEYSEGIIATSACALGLVTKQMIDGSYDALNRYLDIFGDRFYIELHTYNCERMFEGAGMTQQQINEGLVQIGQERGIPFVYANDAHYAFPEQYEFHDAYVAIGTAKGKVRDTIYTPPEERSMWHPQCLYIMDEEDVRDHLNYLPEGIVDEAIANSVLIGDQCNAELPQVRRHLPTFIPKECPWLSDEKKEEFPTAESLFVHLVIQGIEKKYGPVVPKGIWERVEREVEAFLEPGLENYFLLDWDKMQYCADENILTGPGRGSAAGSIVAYALGITDVDPIYYDLIFERFWNPGRAKGFPDIDTDFARQDRPKVIKYLKKRWGENKVRPIGTTSRMKPKAAAQRIALACAITYAEADEVKRIIDEVPNINIHGPDSVAWSRESDPDYVHTGKSRTIYVEDHVGDKIEEWIKADRDREDLRRKYIRLCSYLTNRIENYGIHASGVVVSDVDLSDELPGDLRGPKDDRKTVTQFVMDDVDERQFVKSDVLGLKNLDTLDDWQKQVEAELDDDWIWSGLDKEEWPEEMWELLWRGFSAGIFQIEDGLARPFCQKFKPKSVEDLAIAGSIIRPGPNKSIESFLLRRDGGEDEKFDGRKISLLKDILSTTYGWFLYQEQVIAFFTALGYNPSDADAVRKILGKKKPEEMQSLHEGIGEWEGKGYKVIAYPQLGEKVAEEIWDVLEDFASYSFNKAHSIAYAIIGFRCLLAKYYGMDKWYKSCITTVEQTKRSKLVPAYAREARMKDIGVYPPNILTSEQEVRVVDGNIYLGFNEIKNVGSGGQVILELREQGVDLTTPELLIEHLNENAKAMTKLKSQYKKEGREWDGPAQSLKQRLNSGKVEALINAGAWDELGYRNISLSEKQKFEKEFLEVILTDNSAEVLANNQDVIADCDDYTFLLEHKWAGEKTKFVLPGVITNVYETKAKASGKSMAIVTIEYQSDSVEFVVAPPAWRSHKFLWKERQTGIFTLARTERGIVFEDGIKLT